MEAKAKPEQEEEERKKERKKEKKIFFVVPVLVLLLLVVLTLLEGLRNGGRGRREEGWDDWIVSISSLGGYDLACGSLGYLCHLYPVFYIGGSLEERGEGRYLILHASSLLSFS